MFPQLRMQCHTEETGPRQPALTWCQWASWADPSGARSAMASTCTFGSRCDIDRGRPEGARLSTEGALLFASVINDFIIVSVVGANSYANLPCIQLSLPTSLPHGRSSCANSP